MSERAASPAVSTDAARLRPVTAPQVPQDPQPAAWNALLQLQRTAGNRVTQSLLAGSPIQAKRRIGPVDDGFEREADRVADEVVRKPDAVDDPTLAIVRQTFRGGVQRKCAKCEEDEEETIRRQPLDGSPVNDLQREPGPGMAATASAGDAAPAAFSGLGTGRPLPPDARTYFEPRFGQDFSVVRIHTGPTAHQAAGSIAARAFTFGQNVVFGSGEFNTASPRGKWLLAHELAHVVQQSRGQARPQAAGLERGALESQADAAATAVLAGRQSPALDAAGLRVQKFEMCRALLDARSQGTVPEAAVRNAIINQIQPLGPTEREFPIPAGSAAAFRTEGGGRRRGGSVINPQVTHPDIYGYADVAQLNGAALELIEVKRAEWTEVEFAERQLLNYVSKGNRAKADVNSFWRDRGHTEQLTSVRGMPTNRFSPLSPLRIDSVPVSVSWCRNGVMTFKAMGDQDPEIFLCGVSDRGRIDAFLDRVLDRAQIRIDDYIRTQIEGPAARQLSSRDLREIVRLILSRPEVQQFLPPGLNNDFAIDLIVRELRPFETIIRAKATELLQRAVAELRRLLQAEMRSLLQASFNALCATTAAMTAQELLNEFNRRMRGRAVALIPIAIATAAAAMAAPLLKELGEAMLEALMYLAALVAIVIVVVALWEVAAAIVAAGAIEAAVASLVEFLGFVLSRAILVFV